MGRGEIEGGGRNMLAGTLIDDLIATVARSESRIQLDSQAVDCAPTSVENWYPLAVEHLSANELLGVA